MVKRRITQVDAVGVSPQYGFKVVPHGVLGFASDSGHENNDADLHEYVVVNPCGSAVGSAEGLSGALYGHLGSLGVTGDKLNDDIKMAKKHGVVYCEYTLENDVQQAIIHVYSEESYPSSRRRSVENISAYYEKLQDLYRRVFQVAQDNNKSIVRVPMIGGGVKMGKEKITKDIVKQNVAEAEAACETFKQSMLIEFCIFNKDEHEMWKSDDVPDEESMGDEDVEEGVTVLPKNIVLKNWFVCPTNNEPLGVFVKGEKSDTKEVIKTGRIVYCASKKKIKDDKKQNYTLCEKAQKDESRLDVLFKNGFPKDTWQSLVDQYYSEFPASAAPSDDDDDDDDDMQFDAGAEYAAGTINELSEEGRMEEVNKRGIDSVEDTVEVKRGMKRFKFQGSYRASDYLLHSIGDQDPKFDKVINSVDEFINTRFNIGSLGICLKSQRILAINNECVTSFFWIMMHRNSEFLQEVVGERVILVHDRRTNQVDPTILVSGQHRGAILLLLHLGMAPVLTEDGPAYIKPAEATDAFGRSYDYERVSAPYFNWGYRNFELWEDHLKQELAKYEGKNPTGADRKRMVGLDKLLNTYEHCFVWISKLKTLSCFDARSETRRNLLAMESVKEFYKRKFHYYSVTDASREMMFRFFVAAFCLQRQQSFDTLAVMACSPVVQCIRTCIDMYDTHEDEALYNLYIRPNLPDCEPASSFYVDLVMANMIIEGQLEGLVPSSSQMFNQEVAFVALTKFSDKFSVDTQFQERLLTRVKRVQIALNYFNVAYDPNDYEDDDQRDEARIICAAAEHRCEYLKLAMRQGGPSLRDALVLFWYMIMDTEKELPVTLQAANAFTDAACPTGARRQIDMKKSIFTKLLKLVHTKKSYATLAYVATHEIKFEPLGVPKQQ